MTDPIEEIGFLSNPDIWPSDKLRRCVVKWHHSGFDANDAELVAQEMYDIEERWAKMVWMERQTNAILHELHKSGIKIPLETLEKFPAFKPDTKVAPYDEGEPQ